MNNQKEQNAPLAPERVALTAAALTGLSTGLSVSPSPEIIQMLAAAAVNIGDQAYSNLTKTTVQS